MPQLDESVAAHLCSPTAIGWKEKASHPSKPCRTPSAFAGRSYASAGEAASALTSMVVLQVYQAKLLSWSCDSQGADKCNRPGTACHPGHRPGDREVHDQPGSVRAPPVAHADGNQVRRQGPLPWCPDFSQRPLWTCGSRFCWALHRSTEVVTGHATLLAKAL